MLDSGDDLGINSRSAERIQLRKATPCSVLRSRDFSYHLNKTDEGGDPIRLVHYNYGSFESLDESQNHTFQYNINDQQEFNGYSLTSVLAHWPGICADRSCVRPFVYLGNFSSGRAPLRLPIPEIRRDDADVTIVFFAQNTVTYTSSTLDPWFHATLPIDYPNTAGVIITRYLPSYTMKVLQPGVHDLHVPDICQPCGRRHQ